MLINPNKLLTMLVTVSEYLIMLKNFVKSPYFLVFVASFASALAALWASYKQDEEGKTYQAALQAKQDSLNKKNDDIIKLTTELKDKSDDHAKKIDEYATNQRADNQKIIELQDKLLGKTESIDSLNQQIATLSKTTLDNMLGSNSFCYFRVEVAPNREYADFYLVHEGKNSLTNVKISILACEGVINEAIPPRVSITSNYENAIAHHDLGNINKGTDVKFLKMYLTDRREQWFNISFKSNSADWYQRIYVRKGPKWDRNITYSLIKVYKVTNDEQIKKGERVKIIEEMMKEDSHNIDKTLLQSPQYVPYWDKIRIHFDWGYLNINGLTINHNRYYPN